MTIVWTNGCFDVIHVDHCRLLNQCKKLGDKLIVGINSDSSVAKIKGPSRPINCAENRAEVLLSMSAVDEVVVYDEETPCKAIERIRPDIVVKGRGYSEQNMPEFSIVKSYGGNVIFIENGTESSTEVIERIRNGR